MSRYDIEKFDPPPDPDLVCCICQCVLDRAVECPCRHVFCQGCIERWLTNRHTCPTCRKRTKKEDLKTVLPLVQNMLNRLLMVCDFYENGCLDKIMLENYEMHTKDCGYEMKKCRFIKCGKNILKMNLQRHETVECEHRESLCGGECGLMIALSDRPLHDCMDALKSHIDEKNKMIDTLKSKLFELNNLSQSLNDQLEQLRQQLDESRPVYSPSSSFSDSDSNITEFMSDIESFLDDSSNGFDNTLDNDNADVTSPAGNDNTLSNNNDSATVDPNDTQGNEVIDQVEVTVVNSLFDLSSQLERVRDEMRTVLNTGMAENTNLTEDFGMRSARIDDIIETMSRSINNNSVRSTRNETQTDSERDGQDVNTSNDNIADRTENESDHENRVMNIEQLNNNVTDNENHSDVDTQSDHMWNSDRNSDRQASQSEVSGDNDHASNHSFSPSIERSSVHSYRSYSDRHSRSISLASSPSVARSPSVRSIASRSSYRSPSPDFSDHFSQHSTSSPRFQSSKGSVRSPSLSSLRSDRSSKISVSSFSSPPNEPDDERSERTLSPSSAASGSWFSDDWQSDHQERDDSRHSGDNWSDHSVDTFRNSEAELSPRDLGSDDEGSCQAPESPSDHEHTQDERLEIRSSPRDSEHEDEESVKMATRRLSSEDSRSTRKLSCRSMRKASLSEYKDSEGVSLAGKRQLSQPDTTTGLDGNPALTSNSMKTDKQNFLKSKKQNSGLMSKNAVKIGQMSNENAVDEHLTHVSGECNSFDSFRVKCFKKEHNARFTRSASDNGARNDVHCGEANIAERKRKSDTSERENLQTSDGVRNPKRTKSTAHVLESRQPRASHAVQTSLPQSSSTSSQNLNVKIDLSLYNISGQLLQPRPSPVSLGTAKTSGASARKVVSTATSTTTKPDNEHGRKSSIPTRKSGRPKTQNRENAHHTAQRRTGSNGERTATASFGKRTFPNSWRDHRDDSESESDHTWEPGSEKSETDDVLTEEDEILSDSSYEVMVPKTAADLLEEYKSDETDESWTPT